MVFRFYSQYLNLQTGLKHRTVVIHDGRLPPEMVEGLKAVRETNCHFVDGRVVNDHAKYVRELACSASEYISIHEFYLDSALSSEVSAKRLCSEKNCDFTSYEFVRPVCTNAQRDTTLARHFGADLSMQDAIANTFFQFLRKQCTPYEVRFESVAGSLRVKDSIPWLELLGPLQEGDVRFCPGSELFYSGKNVRGTLSCSGCNNVVLLKRAMGYGKEELDVAKRLVEIGKGKPSDGFILTIEDGIIVEVCGDTRSAKLFREITAEDEAYRTLNEVGVGLNISAVPAVREWSCPANEALPGVHLGFGADPGKGRTFGTAVHFDIVERDVRMFVNDVLMYTPAGFKFV